jgi:hypothetical protein
MFFTKSTSAMTTSETARATLRGAIWGDSGDAARRRGDAAARRAARATISRRKTRFRRPNK